MNKTVLITGASRGIGKAIAHKFAKEGFSIVINCSKSSHDLLTLKEELEQLYSIQVLASVGNVGDFSYVKELFSQIQTQFGGVDILINNAGISHIGLLTDMEIDECTGNAKKWVFYDDMRRRFAEAGYEIPNIVFWNVNSRHDVFHADKNRRGVQLCSGQSASTFQTLMKSVGLTPMEMMMNVLTSDRYANVTIE